MTENNQCVFDNLIRRNIIKYRGESITLIGKETQLLNDFSSLIRNDKYYRYIISIPENSAMILRSLITEILYLAVEKNFGHVYFITDPVGKAFLTSMLYEMHTDSVNLRFLLLNYQSAKIKIYENKLPRSISANDLVVHFRSAETISEFPDAQKEICIFTLRDMHKFGSGFDRILSDLQEDRWISIQGQNDEMGKKQDIKNGMIQVNTLKGEDIALYFASIEAMRIDEGPLHQYMESFGYFYATVPIPLKWYDYYKKDVIGGGFNVGKLPSESTDQIKDLGWHDCLLLKGVCTEMENKIFETNEKYLAILKTLKKCVKDEKQTALVMPNKLITDAFVWGIEQDQRARPLRDGDFSIYYPEKYFCDALMDEKKYDHLLFPFVPSPEMLLTSDNLSNHIDFCLYPQEKEFLKESLENIKAYIEGSKLTLRATCSFSSLSDPLSKLEGSSPHSQKKKKERIGRRDNQQHYVFRELEGNQDSYTRFLNILAEGDPSESDEIRYSEWYIDQNSYVFVDEEGDESVLLGHESVILFNENETFTYSKYRWMYPRSIRKGDTIIIIPHDVRIEFLKEEIYKNMTEHEEDFEMLIEYVADWKAALLDVRKRYNLTEIHNKLVNSGLERMYITITKWFEGLYDDPKTSAFVAITNSKYNIGPKNVDDIRIFGKTFGLDNLVKHARTIHAAMVTFRANNQHFGRIAMKRIIQKIDEPEIRKKCPIKMIKKVNVIKRK